MRRLMGLFLFVLVLLITFTLRFAYIASIPPGIHFDEGLNLLRFWRYANGYGHPLVFNEAPEPFDYIVRGVYGYFVSIHPITMRLFSVYLTLIATAATIATTRTLWHTHPRRNQMALIAGLTVAVIPAYVILGRAIYRANWMAATAMLSFAFLIHAWRKPVYYLPMGATVGAGTMMYPGGIFLPPVFYGTAVLMFFLKRDLRHNWRWLAGGFFITGVMLLPWLYLLLTLPDWLLIRVDDLTGKGLPLISNPAQFASQLRVAVGMIFMPHNSGPLMYNTRTTAFLNPALALLFLFGLAICLLRLNRPRHAAPIFIGIGMLMPPALTITPEEAVRYMGVFGVLGVMTGIGGGIVYQWFARRRLEWVGIVGICLLFLSPIYTWWRFQDHYDNWRGDDRVYFVTIRRQMEFVLNSDTPLYMPLDYLNYRTTLAYLRPKAYPKTRAYQGEPLPEGIIFLPTDGTYGSPLLQRPTTSFALLLPETGEIVILPPLSAKGSSQLEEQLHNEGEQLQDLGYLLAVDAMNNPLTQVRYRESKGTQPIAVFDHNLELLDMVVPDQVMAGSTVEVLLYWRLRREAGEDYFVNVQLWDTSGRSWGKQDDNFSHIFEFIAPTPLWTPGQVFVERRWLTVFPETPDGGYRVALAVQVHPGPKSQPFSHAKQVASLHQRMLGERVIVGDVPVVNPGDIAFDGVFGHQIALEAVTITPSLEALQPGDTLTIKLNWRAIEPPTENYIAFVHLLDESSDTLLAQIDAEPASNYPTTTWNSDTRWQTTWTLSVPPDANPKPIIRIGLYSYPSLERLNLETERSNMSENMIIIR